MRFMMGLHHVTFGTLEFAGKLQASIDARTDGEPTIPAEEVYRRLRLD